MRSGTEPLDPRRLQPCRTVRCHVIHDPQRGQVETLPLPGGQLPDAGHHGWDQQHVLHAVPFDQFKCFEPIEAAHDDDVVAVKQVLQTRGKGSVVVQGARGSARRRRAESVQET